MAVNILEKREDGTTCDIMGTFSVNGELIIVPIHRPYAQGGFSAVRTGGGAFNVTVSIVASLADMTNISASTILSTLTNGSPFATPTQAFIGNLMFIVFRLVSGGGATITVYGRLAR